MSESLSPPPLFFLRDKSQRFLVRYLQYATQTTFARITRIVAALTLVLALLCGSAPQGSLAFAAPAAECSMSCCTGKPPHAAGDCASVSCHVKPPGQAASSEPQPAAHEGQHDNNAAVPPEQTAGNDTHHRHESHARQAAHDPHSGQLETQHAKTRHASHAPETSTTGASPQPEAGQPDGSQSVAVSAHASVAPPCPADCGMAASSFGNNLRQRDAATHTQARRPRPPARVAALRHFSSLPRTSSDRRRLTPPRAPPAAL